LGEAGAEDEREIWVYFSGSERKVDWREREAERESLVINNGGICDSHQEEEDDKGEWQEDK